MKINNIKKYEDDAIQRFMEVMQESLARYYSEEQSRRIKQGIQRKKLSTTKSLLVKKSKV
jgi:hypothetical protein